MSTQDIAVAAALYGAKVLINIFGPQPPFAMQPTGFALDSEEFIQCLTLVTKGAQRRSRLQRLKNAEEFYPAELDAIQAARYAVNLEY